MRANTEIVSSDWQAGTMPMAEMAPTVGFSPTMLPNAAGTRPEPAVSVPRAISTIPAATATPDPDEDPPGTCAALNTLRGVPYGLRTPTRPVANWSRLVLPNSSAPASSRRCTDGADRARDLGVSGQPAVVGIPATSMLSFTATVRPHSGRPRGPSASSARA